MSDFMSMAANAAQQYMSHPQANTPHPQHSPPAPQQHTGYGGPSPYHTGPPQPGRGGPPGPPGPPHHVQGPPPPPGAPPPPQCPPPWVAIWDGNTHRYYFENMQTKQTQWQFPGAGPPPGPPGGATVYENVTVQEKQQPQQQKSGGGYGKVALGAAAGLAGGALLAHEGDKIHEHWEEDKYRAEHKFSRPFEGGHADYRREYGYAEGGRGPEYITNERTEYIDERPGYVRESETTYVDDDYTTRQDYGYERREDDYSYTDRVEERRDDYVYDERIEDRRDDSFVDDAAGWTGEKVQEVEDIPQDVEQDFDRVEDSFDAGRDEQYAEDAGDGGW